MGDVVEGGVDRGVGGCDQRICWYHYWDAKG